MLASPEFEAPKIIRKLGIEWLFRLKTDTRRRTVRLAKSIYGVALRYNLWAKMNWKTH